MKLVVTGGTGFVGSHFLNVALSQGHEVLAIRRSGRASRLSPLREPSWIERSIETLTESDLSGCEALVHFASVGVSPQKATWGEMIEGNVAALLRILTLGQSAGVRRFVLAGSFAEYGRSADRYALIPPDAPLLPTGGYAASKAAGFISAFGLAAEQSLELCYLRIFSAYGEGQFSGNFWPELRRAAQAGEDFRMTPGAQVRDYIPVEDVASAFLDAVLRTDVIAGHPVVENIGSGMPTSMLEFAEAWWKRWDAKGRILAGALPYRPGEVMRYAGVVGARSVKSSAP